MIANSFLIDFYLLCEKVSDVGKSTRSLMLGRYSIYFYLVKINLSLFEDHSRTVRSARRAFIFALSCDA
jgi:hypothetical protein